MKDGADPYRIAARMERLPLSPWHTKIRLIIGSVNFSDAFDALTVAYVLPVLIPLWHMKPTEIGGLISVGYAGQVIGGFTSGWLAERYGRIPLAVANIVLYSAVSFACIFAQDYATLVALRFLQGIGLGGEVPVANTYINEFAQSTKRGRFVILQQMHVPGRPHHGRAGGDLRRAEFRLAVDVRAGRPAGAPRLSDDQGAAGIAALAREPRPQRGGRPRHDADRGPGLRSRRQAAAADTGQCCARGGLAKPHPRALPGDLSAPHLVAVGAVVLRLSHHLRDERLAAQHLPHRLSRVGDGGQRLWLRLQPRRAPGAGGDRLSDRPGRAQARLCGGVPVRRRDALRGRC